MNRKMKPKVFLRKYFRILLGGTVLLAVIISAIFAPMIAGHDPLKLDVLNNAKRPTPEHILGTDNMGRDVFARLLYGGRVSLLVGLCVGILGTIFGVIVGMLSGYYPKVDKILMRVMDGLSAFPSVLMALLMLTAIGNGVPTLVLALSISYTPAISRLVRGIVLSVKEQEHVEAARAMGASDLRIMFQYILPMCASPLIIRFTITCASAILSEASLSFLGLGVGVTTPTWGNMLTDGKNFIFTAPYLLYAPGIAVIITVLAINMIGDGLRDVLDPRLKS